MQIGFVIEGRSDGELPETLFACVAVNKPQEEQAEFLFEDEDQEPLSTSEGPKSDPKDAKSGAKLDAKSDVGSRSCTPP